MTTATRPPSRRKQRGDEQALDAETARRLLREMLRIRRFEEACAEQYSAMKIRGFLHLYIGEEAVAVGAMQPLRPDDAVVATYREHGHALVRGISMNAIMAEMFGKVEGCSRGRGGSMHLFDAATRFYGGNAIVAGGLPVAVGLALADKMTNRPRVTACFFGDGAVSEGEFHECLNLAALWKLPVVFFCENNLYAMGTALSRSQVQTDLAERARSYMIPAEAVDGMDVLACTAAAQRSVDYTRAGHGPSFIEFRTYRFRAHSMYDPDLYRSKEEVEQWKQRCPIATFTAKVLAMQLLTEADIQRLETEIAEEIRAAIAFADAGHLESVEDLYRFVYSEQPSAASSESGR